MSKDYQYRLTIDELAYLAGTRISVIEKIISLELISPWKKDPEIYFQSNIIPTVKRLLRLHNQLGVSWTSMGLVLDLMDRINDLEARVQG